MATAKALDTMDDTPEAASNPLASHHFERYGGGYDYPLTHIRKETRPPETIEIGGIPPVRRVTDMVTPATGTGRTFKPSKHRTLYAYPQFIKRWNMERYELVTEGVDAPAIIEWGYWTNYTAHYWSVQPTMQGAMNEAQLRQARRNAELARQRLEELAESAQEETDSDPP
jgi:hypothetical protein